MSDAGMSNRPTCSLVSFAAPMKRAMTADWTRQAKTEANIDTRACCGEPVIPRYAAESRNRAFQRLHPRKSRCIGLSSLPVDLVARPAGQDLLCPPPGHIGEFLGPDEGGERLLRIPLRVDQIGTGAVDVLEEPGSDMTRHRRHHLENAPEAVLENLPLPLEHLVVHAHGDHPDPPCFLVASLLPRHAARVHRAGCRTGANRGRNKKKKKSMD